MAAVRLFLPHGQIWIHLILFPLQQRLERFPICFKPIKWLTLSSVSLMIPDNKTESLQRRRTNVHRQLALWPQEKSQQPDIWQVLGSNSKKALIAALARLIEKAVYPPNISQTQEVSHER